MLNLWSSCHLSCSRLRFLSLALALSVIFSTSIANAGTEDGIVETKNGKIRGSFEKTSRGRQYFAFRGVRYAVAPIEERRFKEPMDMSPWTEAVDATTDGPVCPQLHVVTNQVIGQEDCLSLNVFTTNLKPQKLKSVIVFLHGGGFSSGTGSSELYGPDYLLSEKFVIVTIQYRLSVLGFLSTGDEKAPGNYGLLDQIKALEWVQKNIAAFGGEPRKVSLLGEGAGAASATLLTLTQKAKGLFRNVIALAGSPLNSQYFQKTPLESARELASRLECTYQDTSELVDCFRKVEVEKLVKEANAMFSFFSFPRWFAPSVDNVLFRKSPEEILKEGSFLKVPILLGLAKHEGAFYYPLTLNSFNDGKYDGNFIDQRLPRLLPVISEFESKLFPLTKAVKKRYFTNIEIDNEVEFRPRYIEFLTDLLFTRSTSLYANQLANQSVSVFYFVLDYYGTNSIMNLIGDSDIKSIAHGDVLQYIFTQVLGENKALPEDDREFAKKIFLPLLSTFAKTGAPKVKSQDLIWPKYTHEMKTVASIGKEIHLIPRFRSNILEFWHKGVPEIVATKSTKKEEL